MLHACAAHKITDAPDARDDLFSPEFYKPYALAVQSTFLLCSALRDTLCAQGSDPGVRMLSYRLKSPDSISEKLRQKGMPVTRQAAGHALHDVSGLRVVLETTRQVYRFAEMLACSPAVELVDIRDYIRFPKPSGYRSLHLILRVPVTIGKEPYLVPVEVQLRTAGMDAWASIEHDLVYKPK